MKGMVAFGGTALMLLTIAHALAPDELSFLPLGGSPVSQIGIVLGLCVALATLVEMIRRDR